MEKNEDNGRPGAKRAGAVWAALALSAGLAAAPAAALAEEAGGTADAGAGDAAAAQGGQAQPQAGGQQGSVGEQAGGGSAQATPQAQAPAASSDRGTYEKAGLHRVTVTYVDAGGRQIAPAHREALADGESYGVESPAVGGYELADASQATVSGTVAKGSGDVSVVVRYRSTLVTYTVVHERQVGPRSSEYRVSESETLTAPAGTRVTAAPKSYVNYTCATDAKGRTAEVTPDGRATIVIRYDVVVPTYGVYFVTKGSYVAPQTGAVGDEVTTPEAPTRAGYSFAGWDTDGDGRADALPAALPDHDVTATALWKPGTATYLVKYWGEDEGRDGSYHLLRTDALSGTTDSVAPAAARLGTAKGGEYQWYQYAREDQDVTVSGDGTTVLNVYYDWKRVKVYFKAQLDNTGDDYMKNPDVISPITLKMYERQNLSDGNDALATYKEHGGSKKGFVYWFAVPQSLIYGGWVAPRPNNVNWTRDDSLELYMLAQFTDDNLSANYAGSSYQDADGSSYTAPELEKSNDSRSGVKYYYRYRRPGFKLVAWRTSTRAWDGNGQESIAWGEWQTVSEKDISNGIFATPWLPFSTSNVVVAKYDRIPYDVTYYSGGKAVAKRTQPFGSTVDVS
ncbi:InlB B-repeat-containing protein, partial [Parafannyhessea umbonata]|uniref:InlB B-repeat-containing protein n=1 Tax=Parafannyhessea umbonata TaxID=604330 RepID=UPI002A7FC717